jgi:hypothetical protein
MRRLVFACCVFWVSARAGLVAAAGPASRPTTRPSILDRLSPQRLERFDQDRAALAKRIRRVDVPYPFVRGTFHMHSELSHDSRGKVSEIIAAAKATGTKIVGFTEHPSQRIDVIEANVKGWRDGVYFLAGTESHNELFWPGREGEADLRFVSHPEEVPAFERARYDGMELYNTHSDALDEPLKALFAAILLNLPAVKAHPEAAFESFLDYPGAFLSRFDRLTREGPFVGIAANDCHQNVRLRLQALPDGSVEATDADSDRVWKDDGLKAAMLRAAFGQSGVPEQPVVLTDMQFDPYETGMRHVGTFLQIGQISEKSVRHALRTGRVIIGFEIIAPLPSFGFWVEAGAKPVGTVGDHVPWRPGLVLRCALPAEADIRIVRDGRTLIEAQDDRHAVKDIPAGAYRLEAFITLAGERWPWVISNPIYVMNERG